MLHAKSCNVKHNSESVFRYFASVVNTNESLKCNRQDHSTICSYRSLHKVGYVPLYTLRKSLFGIPATGLGTLHSSSARLDEIHPVQIHLIGIHLITVVSVIKRLSLYEFTLWGRDLLSVVRIIEGFFFKENIGKLCRDIGNCLKLCPYREV